MTDETRSDAQPTEGTPEVPFPGITQVDTDTAVANQEEPPAKLHQDVNIKDVGPCRKKIRVAVDRTDVEGRMREHFSKLVQESNVTGFRPGKAPRRLIEKRFYKEVSDRVKGEVLLASLEQLGEDHDVAPLAPPNIDPEKIELPKVGPLVYEFEVEVRPQFDLPEYRGLRIKRPVKTFNDDDVAEMKRRILNPYGQIVPKEEGTVEVGDVLIADITFRRGEEVIGNLTELKVGVEKRLAFKDGLVRDFAEKLKGARAGDTRVMDVQMSEQAASGTAGQTVQATVEIKDVKTIRPPEMTREFLEQMVGITSADQLDEVARVLLERQLEHQQRRSARLQILERIAAASTWELPRDLLARQARQAMARRMMEMKADGISEQEIEQNRRVLEQNILQTTALTLKEHFVLQKIAEVEKIEVNDADIDEEIERMAEREGISARRVRARLEKEDGIETLMAEMVERKALDLILDTAEYEDVPLEPEQQAGTAPLATVEVQAVPGQMHDVVAETAAETPAEGSESAEASASTSQEGQ